MIFLESNYIEVKTVKLDDYFQDQYPKIDMIKMDIEGAESAALSGMSQILTKNHGIIFIVEFFPELIIKAGNNPAKLIESFASFGFNIFIVDNSTGALSEENSAQKIIDLCDG